MLDLTEVIYRLKQEINDLEDRKKEEMNEVAERYDREIDRYKQALVVNLELNEVCLNCKGNGIVIEYDGGYEDRGTSYECKLCSGTGRAVHAGNS